jgi:hypothetical protein
MATPTRPSRRSSAADSSGRTRLFSTAIPSTSDRLLGGEEHGAGLDPHLVRPQADAAVLEAGAGPRIELPPQAADPGAGDDRLGPAAGRQVPALVRTEAVEAVHRIPEPEQGIHLAAEADLQPGGKSAGAAIWIPLANSVPCSDSALVTASSPLAVGMSPPSRAGAEAFSPDRRTGCPASEGRSAVPRPESAADTPGHPTRCSGRARGPAASRTPRPASSPPAPGR